MCSGLVLRRNTKASAAAELHAARIALGRQALAANPGNHKVRSLLADSLLQADCADLALDLFGPDTSAVSDLDELTALARAHYAKRNFTAALDVLEAARACPGFGREQLLLRFEALVSQGEVSAEQMLADIQQLDPDNAAALKLMARRAFRQAEPNRALLECQHILSRRPGDTSALHYRMVALALLHRESEAAAAMDLEGFLAVKQLPVPQGWNNYEEFHQQLIAEVRADASLRPDPRGLATSQGRQTQSRSCPEGPAMQALITSISAAIEVYADELPRHDTHPFVQYRPSRGALQFWSVLYPGAGRQKPHFHPGGWLSGVYHASGSGEQHDGSLVLGECLYLERAKQAAPWGQRVLPSRAGQLILFPSFTPHATTVPAAGTERVSVAFDVTPSE